MQYTEQELIEVRLECIKCLARLDLAPEKRAVAQGFVDSYTPLTPLQQQQFDKWLSELAPPDRENIMTYIIGWKQEGIEIGIKKGIEKGIEKGKLEQAQEMSIKIVSGRFGECSTELVNVIKKLPLEILDLIPEKIFSLNSLDELRRWLDEKLEASEKD